MKQRVVLVDTEQNSRTTIGKLLQPLDLELSTLERCEFPYEGWDEHSRPDLVIVSCQGAVGAQAYQFIAAMLTHNIKVIVISRAIDWKEAKNLFLVGVFDVISADTLEKDLPESVALARIQE